NAARYTPADTKIEIDARVDGRRFENQVPSVEIRVSDRGPGLPPGAEARVFEKFFHGEAPSADSRRGVGLGLSICQGIVHAHGGRISARNRPGSGAEFTIALPSEKTPPAALHEVAAARST